MIPLSRIRPNNGIWPNNTTFASVSAPTCYHCARIAIKLQQCRHFCRLYASQQAQNQGSPRLKYQRWTKEEDDIVISLRRERKTWPEIQTALPHRTYQAVSARWNQYLDDRARLMLAMQKVVDSESTSCLLRRQAMVVVKVTRYLPSEFSAR